MNDWSSPLLDDGLTYCVSYERSTMGAYMDEDTHAKSWMAGSPTMLGNNKGGSDGRESSFAKCWCSSFHSYSSWMTVHVVCATPTLSVGCSLFTTSEESRMDEHKTKSSRGTPRCKYGGRRKESLWELEGITTNLRKNWVGWCWESVKDEQVCEHDPQHHWGMVVLLNERKADSQSRQCPLPHEIV